MLKHQFKNLILTEHLSNTKNDISFSGDAKFVKDRTGVANGAIRVTNSAIEATIPNLPLSNSQRTVSIWVKYNDIATANYIWGYGSSYNARILVCCNKVQQLQNQI